MAKLTVNGVRSIEAAEIDLSGPITLLCGDNGEGKTSVLLALKAILTGTSACISTKQKDDADGMCADGMTKRATAMLSDDEGQAVASWSKTKCYAVKTQRSVAGLPRASKAAAGLPHFLDMPAKERATVFLEAFQIDPTQQDLTQAITQAELDVSAEELWDDIIIQTWDVVHSQAQEKLTGLKSDWKAVTNETWAADKSENWAPHCLTETAMTEAKLKEISDAAVAAAEAAGRARKEYDAIIIPPAAGDELMCPHCSKAVEHRGGQLAKFQAVDEAERQRLVSTKRALTGRVSGLQDDARKAEDALVAANALAAHSAEDRANRIERAAEINEDIKAQQALVAILGPEGVRANKRENLLHLINGQLEEMSHKLGLDPVRLVWEPDPGKQIPTICARMGQRLYQNLCRSQRWRVQLLIQLLIARRDSSTIILLDDCDILARQRRGPLIMLLKEAGINVVAAMTISDGVHNAPDLASAGLGQTYWVEGGKVLPLGEVRPNDVQAAA